MFGLSLIQFARRHGHKLDRDLRNQLTNLYQPFRWVPCFLHRSLEAWLKYTKRFPVILEFEDGEDNFRLGMEETKSLARRHFRSKTGCEYSSVCCCSAHLTANAIRDLVENCVYLKKVHFDRPVKALLNVASPAVDAEIVNESGFTGKDVTIAVIDTGIYPHDDLIYPENRIIAFQDFVNNRSNPYDDNGHGTHVAGDAAGNGYSSGGQFQGPAPEANLVGVKVLNKQGAGSLSTVMAGVEWCITNKNRYRINVISMSLGSEAAQSAQDDPMVKVVEKAWREGIVVCAAAGNEGPDSRTIASPGTSPLIITVGATDDQDTIDRSDDEVAAYSSRGPTIDGIVKPDLVAPGTDIISLRAPNSYLDKQMSGNRVGDKYFTLSGTSMATPICAGVTALIIQSSPALTPDEVKQRLLAGAQDLGLSPNVQGRGYIDADDSIK